MISVIIPACNEEKYIESTLKSIPKAAEVIVICNGCTDKTEEIAKKYAKVISIRERNVSKARNLGAKLAKGYILVFLDADTLLSNNTLEEIEKTLQNNVIGTCKIKPDINKFKANFAMKIKNLFLWVPWSSGIIFCNRNIFENINGFNEALTKKEDSNFMKRAMKHGKFGIANSCVINSMRRFEKYGYLALILYWIKETIKPTKNPYPIIR